VSRRGQRGVWNRGHRTRTTAPGSPRARHARTDQGCPVSHRDL